MIGRFQLKVGDGYSVCFFIYLCYKTNFLLSIGIVRLDVCAHQLMQELKNFFSATVRLIFYFIRTVGNAEIFFSSNRPAIRPAVTHGGI
jgi:hypothetical protein